MSDVNLTVRNLKTMEEVSKLRIITGGTLYTFARNFALNASKYLELENRLKNMPTPGNSFVCYIEDMTDEGEPGSAKFSIALLDGVSDVDYLNKKREQLAVVTPEILRHYLHVNSVLTYGSLDSIIHEGSKVVRSANNLKFEPSKIVVGISDTHLQFIDFYLDT